MQNNSICNKHSTGQHQFGNSWTDINWKIVDKQVGKLQSRIYVAQLAGNAKLVTILQKKLIKNKANLLFSIRRVTSINRGKGTAGIDKMKYLRPADRFSLFTKMCNEDLWSWDPPPVRRVYVPKPGKSELRPLGIPTVKDRVIQMVVKNALEPEWEAKFEHGSYGFRPARSTQDAMARLWRVISSKKRIWVLDADIKGCFNNIAHEPLLQNIQNFPAHELIAKWLKAGYFEKEQFFDTQTGTPQGGIISPLLANIALHGMEEALKIKYHPDGYVRSDCPFVLVRYADDFVVLTDSEEKALEAKEILREFLDRRGMEFSAEKTNIRDLRVEGLDFLGWTFRLYKNDPKKIRRKAFKRAKGEFVALVTPSKKSIKNVKAKIKTLFRQGVSKPTQLLINQLNPIIVGWANYHRFVNSNKTFRSLDNFMYLQAVRFAKRSHTNKSWEWLKAKYFDSKTFKRRTKTGKLSLNMSNWSFRADSGVLLKMFRETTFENYSSIRYGSNPFNPADKDYYLDRKLKNLFKRDTFRMSILKRQMEICPVCGRNLVASDWGEPTHLHHLIPRKEGGKDLISNLILLHEECHYSIHRENYSKGEMLVLWYKAVSSLKVNSKEDRKAAERRLEALRSAISDPNFSSYIRALAATGLSQTASMTSLSKETRKKNLEALAQVFGDQEVFSMFKAYYAEKQRIDNSSFHLPVINENE